MATPIVEQIAVDIESAINAITTGNGFEQTLTARRPRRYSDVPSADLECFIEQTVSQVIDREANVITWAQTFVLSVFLISSDAAAVAIDIRANQAAADIDKKLMADHQRSNLAIDTRIASVTMFDLGDDYSGVAVAVVVEYRVSDTDPYSNV